MIDLGLFCIGVIGGIIIGVWAERSDIMNDPDHINYFKKYFEHKRWKNR